MDERIDMKPDDAFRAKLLDYIDDTELQAIAMAYVYSVAFRAQTETGDLRRLMKQLYPDGSLEVLGNAMRPIAEGRMGEAAQKLNAFTLADRGSMQHLRGTIAALASFDTI